MAIFLQPICEIVLIVTSALFVSMSAVLEKSGYTCLLLSAGDDARYDSNGTSCAPATMAAGPVSADLDGPMMISTPSTTANRFACLAASLGKEDVSSTKAVTLKSTGSVLAFATTSDMRLLMWCTASSPHAATFTQSNVKCLPSA
eukprot:286437-Rhodomonas_salina.2